MRKILFISFALTLATTAHAYQVCGPDVDGTDYAYTYTMSSTDFALGYWANGTNCTSEIDVYDIPAMCDTVVAGGEAFCSNSWYSTTNFDESKANYGNNCWCRRTKMAVGGKLSDSIGQWVLVGQMTNCQQICASVCADNVANNTNYMRNAIMVLPSY